MKYILLLLVLFNTAGAAETVTDTVTASQTERVRITARRPELRSTAVMTVIRADELESRHQTPSEILNTVPGLHTTTTGGMGGYATVSMRGLGSENVRIYMDGILLNNAVGGDMNLGLIPAEWIDKLEVYRGFIPGKYAGSGMGGVIDISGKKVRKSFGSASVTYGSNNTETVNLLGALKKRRWLTMAKFLYEHSDNDYLYLNDNGTDKTGDDRYLYRQNAQFSRMGASVDVSGRIGAWKLVLSDTYTASQQGIPSWAHYPQTEKVAYSSRDNILALELRPPLAAGNRLSTELRLFSSIRNSTLLDTLTFFDGDIYRQAEINPFKVNSESDLIRNGYRFAGTFAAVDSPVTVIPYLILDGDGESFEFSNLITDDPTADDQLPTYRIRNGLTAGTDITALSKRHAVSLYTHIDNVRGGYSGIKEYVISNDRMTVNNTAWSGGIGMRTAPVAPLQLRMNAGYLYRAPTSMELFGNTGTFLGNTRLKDETGIKCDLGASWTGNAGTVAITGYTGWYRDMIHVVPLGRNFIKAVNIDDVRITGCEAEWDFAFGVLRNKGSISWMRPVDLSDRSSNAYYGKILPNLPQIKGIIRQTGRIAGFEPFVEYHLVGFNYSDSQNSEADMWPTRHLVNAGISRSFMRKSLMLSAEVKNLFSGRYMDLYGFPLPGRQGYVKMSISKTK